MTGHWAWFGGLTTRNLSIVVKVLRIEWHCNFFVERSRYFSTYFSVIGIRKFVLYMRSARFFFILLRPLVLKKGVDFWFLFYLAWNSFFRKSFFHIIAISRKIGTQGNINSNFCTKRVNFRV